MAINGISALKTAVGIGARANLFRVSLTWPSGVSSTAITAANNKLGGATGTETKANLLCKTAALPGMSVGIIEVPTRAGRRIKIPGDRSFTDWTVTFISDENHDVRKAFKDWQENIKTANYESESIRPNNTTSDYVSDLNVYQLNSAGGVIRTYKLFDCFPTDVGAIDLSFDSTDSISEFTVTFQYQYMIAKQGGGSETPTEIVDTNDMDAA